MLGEFDLLMPQTLSEALEMLAEGAADVMPLAGGTNLISDVRGGRRRPGVLMNIAGLDELHGIHVSAGNLVIGGGVTIAELLDDPLIAEHGSVLKDAAAIFANPLVRNRATVGGNLADASPAADTAPALLVLGAEVELVCKGGSRWVPLDEFFVGVRDTVRRSDELLVAVRWPVPRPRSASAFRKLGLRKADAITVLSAAVMVEIDNDGRCRLARIALGAVAPRPVRVHDAEGLLRAKVATPALIAEAARLAAGAACPIDDIRGSADYRRQVVDVVVRRLLTRVAEKVGWLGGS